MSAARCRWEAHGNPAIESDISLILTLGDCQVVPAGSGAYRRRRVLRPIIDVWSRATGYPEAKTIAAAVTARLDDPPENLTLTGFDVVVFEVETPRYLSGPRRPNPSRLHHVFGL